MAMAVFSACVPSVSIYTWWKPRLLLVGTSHAMHSSCLRPTVKKPRANEQAPPMLPIIFSLSMRHSWLYAETFLFWNATFRLSYYFRSAFMCTSYESDHITYAFQCPQGLFHSWGHVLLFCCWSFPQFWKKSQSFKCL